MADYKRLQPFSKLAVIDDLVMAYQGAYTHEDIFEMSLDRVYSYRLYHKELAGYHDRYNNVVKELSKHKK